MRTALWVLQGHWGYTRASLKVLCTKGRLLRVLDLGTFTLSRSEEHSVYSYCLLPDFVLRIRHFHTVHQTWRGLVIYLGHFFPDGDQQVTLCSFLEAGDTPRFSLLLYELLLVAGTYFHRVSEWRHKPQQLSSPSLFPWWPGSYTQYMLDSLILFSMAGSTLWGFTLTGTVENHLFKNQSVEGGSRAATSQMLLNLEVFQLQQIQRLLSENAFYCLSINWWHSGWDQSVLRSCVKTAVLLPVIDLSTCYAALPVDWYTSLDPASSFANYQNFYTWTTQDWNSCCSFSAMNMLLISARLMSPSITLPLWFLL